MKIIWPLFSNQTMWGRGTPSSWFWIWWFGGPPGLDSLKLGTAPPQNDHTLTVTRNGKLMQSWRILHQRCQKDTERNHGSVYTNDSMTLVRKDYVTFGYMWYRNGAPMVEMCWTLRPTAQLLTYHQHNLSSISLLRRFRSTGGQSAVVGIRSILVCPWVITINQEWVDVHQGYGRHASTLDPQPPFDTGKLLGMAPNDHQWVMWANATSKTSLVEKEENHLPECDYFFKFYACAFRCTQKDPKEFANWNWS